MTSLRKSVGRVAVICRRSVVLLVGSLLGLALMAGPAAAAEPEWSDPQYVSSDSGQVKIEFGSQGFPLTTYSVRVTITDNASGGCTYVNYSLVQNNTGDNEGDRIEACADKSENPKTRVFDDTPVWGGWAQGWKFQVCENKRWKGDSCGAWEYFNANGTARIIDNGDGTTKSEPFK